MAKVYISGAITGLEYDAAFQNFENAEQEVKEMGGVPINPMKLDHKKKSDWYDFMEKDIAALLRCEGIYMLKNWGKSKGARCEYVLAKELGLNVVFQK
jgi:hypothetical protein